MDCSDHSDAPEEYTFGQGIEQEKEVRNVQLQNKIRVLSEGKKRRRMLAQRKLNPKVEGVDADAIKNNNHEETQETLEMLPDDVVNFLASNEKKVLLSDSENEAVNQKPYSKKKKKTKLGDNIVILKDIQPVRCSQDTKALLEKRKSNIPRSFSVLKNSKRALRLLSAKGIL